MCLLNAKSRAKIASVNAPSLSKTLVRYHKTFFPHTNGPNKLECLSLLSLSGLK